MKLLYVFSGKGGVGKTTISCNLAFYLVSKGYSVGLLDMDICGPSISCALGISNCAITKNETGQWIPYEYSKFLKCLSMSFLLAEKDSAIIWRGPRKNSLIKEFCKNVDWGEIDYLIIDTPPGIQDEHITLAEQFYGNQNAFALVVTTPHENFEIFDSEKLDDIISTQKLEFLGSFKMLSSFSSLGHKPTEALFKNLDCKTLEVFEKILTKLQ